MQKVTFYPGDGRYVRNQRQVCCTVEWPGQFRSLLAGGLFAAHCGACRARVPARLLLSAETVLTSRALGLRV